MALIGGAIAGSLAQVEHEEQQEHEFEEEKAEKTKTDKAYAVQIRRWPVEKLATYGTETFKLASEMKISTRHSPGTRRDSTVEGMSSQS